MTGADVLQLTEGAVGWAKPPERSEGGVPTRSNKNAWARALRALSPPYVCAWLVPA
jgi:hypothetical protein